MLPRSLASKQQSCSDITTHHPSSCFRLPLDLFRLSLTLFLLLFLAHALP